MALDVSLQRVAFEALGERRGAVVAIDPNDGRVLALVSTPSFDPNPFVNGISSKLYSSLRSSIDRPLYNRATQGQYPPGSTIKPFLGLVALDSGVRSAAQTSWCPGWYRLPGKSHRYRCWNRSGHGRLSLKHAIAQSCDVYFYKLASDMGIDVLHERMSRFGFGQRTGIDLPGESTGLMPSREWKERVRKVVWYPGETVITGIGQGYSLATPVQLASATAALSKMGHLIRPRVVDRVVDPVSRMSTHTVEPISLIFSDSSRQHWDTIIDSMVEVVHGSRGTARRSGAKAAYRFAGKTGTSQLFKLPQDKRINPNDVDERLKDHALFVAFAPVDDPAIALAVIVENGGGGSKVAAPIARTLFDHYLDDGEDEDAKIDPTDPAETEGVNG